MNKVTTKPKPKPVSPLTEKRIETLIERMTGTRVKAKATIAAYTQASRKFLATVKGVQIPTRRDIDRYIAGRREAGISVTTLRLELFGLMKLFSANGWPWTLSEDDFPIQEEKYTPNYLPIAEVEKMIMGQDKLSKEERFYLAVATTWVVRREDLARIHKRDYDDSTFIIHTSKHGKPVRALIPPVLKPVFQGYRPKQLTPGSLSAMFHRICDKTGVSRPPGGGWHMLRYLLDSYLVDLADDGKIKMRHLIQYEGWKPAKTVGIAGGTTMARRYSHPEFIHDDPYEAFKAIYQAHPFLKVWRQALKLKPVATKTA